MISIHCLRKNTAKIHENKQKLATKPHRSADFRFSLPPAQESVPGNYGNVPAESERAGIHMNTAHPIRIQYS